MYELYFEYESNMTQGNPKIKLIEGTEQIYSNRES